MAELLSLKEASKWATSYLDKEVNTSNISYLIQYGRVQKINHNSVIKVKKSDLISYYQKNSRKKEEQWKDRLGQDLNWTLSFSQYKESETTKHVHRLHPYKGKFIPHLVRYFLDDHIDIFKKDVFFEKGDVLLDPFCGSGTTLVEANELGMNAVGVDVSAFNTLISNVKVLKYDVLNVKQATKKITNKLHAYISTRKNVEFENQLLGELKQFNNQYFPSPEFRYRVKKKEINDNIYGPEKTIKFRPTFDRLIKKYNIQLLQTNPNGFIGKWFIQDIRDEIDFVFNEITDIKHVKLKWILSIILSRTVRSCRATTHSDLGTLIEPQITTYYCKKHSKICKPLFSIFNWWIRYANDTVDRLKQFDELRTNTKQLCLTGDSRTIDIFSEVNKQNTHFGEMLARKKIDGIFSSPPYVGLIDYHEQHAYSYDLFQLERNDELEIGPLYRGQGREARKSYIKGVVEVLNNCKQFLKSDYNIFLVANDKYGLYPMITELAGMKIVNQYKRPVLNRVEKSRRAYSETVFHLKGDNQ